MTDKIEDEKLLSEEEFSSNGCESGYSETAFRLDSLPAQESAYADSRLKKKKFVKRLGWSAYLGVNPTSYQYSETPSQFFMDPQRWKNCEANESRWVMRIDEEFNDFVVIKSFFKSLGGDWLRLWRSRDSSGKKIYFIVAVLLIIAYKIDPYALLAVLLSPLGLIGVILVMTYLAIKWMDNDHKYHRLALSGLNEFHFSRKTGKVVAPWGEFPFYEFDAYIAREVSLLGDHKYSLRIIHRYRNNSRSPSSSQPLDFIVKLDGGVAEHQAAWDMLCCYMDVTQPLPDIPQLEPFRDLDFTTRLHDKEGKRTVESTHWQNFYKQVSWKELEEARASHRLVVKNTKWKGRENLMVSLVPNYLAVEEELNLEIKSDGTP